MEFKQGGIEKFAQSPGIKLAPLVYGLLSLTPLILIAIALAREFTVPKLVVLILLLVVSAYSVVGSRRRACANCKMRLICPGSAAK